jgi:hypothetical protein
MCFGWWAAGVSTGNAEQDINDSPSKNEKYLRL